MLYPAVFPSRAVPARLIPPPRVFAPSQSPYWHKLCFLSFDNRHSPWPFLSSSNLTHNPYVCHPTRFKSTFYLACISVSPSHFMPACLCLLLDRAGFRERRRVDVSQ